MSAFSNTLRGLIHRALITATAASGYHASVKRWIRFGWTAERSEYQQAAVRRLNDAISTFRRASLLPHWSPDHRGSISTWSELESLPLLTRQRLQNMRGTLQEQWRDHPGVSSKNTGGSTGEPTWFYERSISSIANLAYLAPMLTMLGWQPGLPRLALWGMDAAQRQLFQRRRLSSIISGLHIYGGYSLTEDEYRGFFELVSRSCPCAVYGYPTMLEKLANLMIEHRWELPAGCVKTAWTTAETLHPHQRERIGQVLGTSPRDVYGSRECGWIALECSQGTRHVNPRYIVEVIDGDSRRTVEEGETGNLVVTDLTNDVTPFIRYEIGDVGSIGWKRCACGRGGYHIKKLLGRMTDIITLPNGKLISGLWNGHMVRSNEKVKAGQIVRLAKDEFEFRFIGESIGQDDLAGLEGELSSVFINVTTRVVKVDKLQYSRQGKLLQYIDLTNAG